MSNPDTKTPSLDSLYIAVPFAFLFSVIIIIYFYRRNSADILFWLIISLSATVITLPTNIISQYTTCSTIDIGSALLGTLPTFGVVLIGLGLSSISYCRIPIASLFAPLFMRKTVDIVKSTDNSMSVNNIKKRDSKECCIPKLSLMKIENEHPAILGLSYGFYVFFSMLFGIVIGSGVSRAC
jgi:hypothetical protein